MEWPEAGEIGGWEAQNLSDRINRIDRMKRGLKAGSREALAEGCGLKLEDGKLRGSKQLLSFNFRHFI